MNAFRLCGDMLHLVSIFLLLWKLRKSKNCVGISCRMQELYAIVFVARYIDLLYHFVSIYNTIMKVVFITSTMYLVYLMRFKPPISQTYDKKSDSAVNKFYFLGPCAILSLITCEYYTIPELLWTFSIWLESVAIVPQLLLLQRLREVENLTSDYVAAMGMYRAFYILNWIYRYTVEIPPHVSYVSWMGGAIQVLLYLDFFYYYAISKWFGQKLVLPMTAEV